MNNWGMWEGGNYLIVKNFPKVLNFREVKITHQGNLGNLLKSGFRFSTKAFLPSLASSDK